MANVIGPRLIWLLRIKTATLFGVWEVLALKYESNLISEHVQHVDVLSIT